MLEQSLEQAYFRVKNLEKIILKDHQQVQMLLSNALSLYVSIFYFKYG
jgi:hypothetical protein